MKLTAAEIIHVAITWAEESMLQMINGCPDGDPYRAEVLDQLKRMRAYKRRRYGKPSDPFEGSRLVGLNELRALNKVELGPHGWPVGTKICDCVTGEVEPQPCHCSVSSQQHSAQGE